MRETVICTSEAQACLSTQCFGIMKALFRMQRPDHEDVPLEGSRNLCIKNSQHAYSLSF